jgi:predicted TIM-barrel fold metal-dependent hydrolase
VRRRKFLFGLAAQGGGEDIVDIHQHTDYWDRKDDDLIAHQEKLGAKKTILLPAGSKYGLAARASGNDRVLEAARRHPGRFYFCANELPDLPETRTVLEKYLKLGAIGIGEQKFPVAADSPHIETIAALARDYRVPVLLHFEYDTYNKGFPRFRRILEKFATVNFIGHAQTWWGHIDARLEPSILYPNGKVTPGGLTDRWLREFPNLYGDLSAGSGVNAMARDPDHARAFLARHQDKLLFGSDCQDADTAGSVCVGRRQLEQLRRWAPDAAALRKILWENAHRVFKLA